MPLSAHSLHRASALPETLLPVDISPRRGPPDSSGLAAPRYDEAALRREIEALGEAIYAGDPEDARRRLNFFKALFQAAGLQPETVWEQLERAAGGRLKERTERGLLEAAIESPGIPWKDTDQHLLFLARALQDKDQVRTEQERNFFIKVMEGGVPLHAETGFETAYYYYGTLAGRLDWDNPYAARNRVNEAVSYAMERLAAAMSQYLASGTPDEDPKKVDLKEFFRTLWLDQKLMFVVNPPEATSGASRPMAQGIKAPEEELSEQEEQYLGSNALFYREMMGKGYLTVFGNIVLGSLALLKDDQARNKFLTAQYRNIRSIARKYDTPGIERIDLIQTAWLGLEKALAIYEPWQGTLFWTLAKKWVFGAIILEFKKTLRFLRTTQPVEALEGESYQEALESLIIRRGIAGLETDEAASPELTYEEARAFVKDLTLLLDEQDKAILLCWLKEPNIVKVADQFGTSKQNISNALGRIQNAGRQLAHQRQLMPAATWEKFRRAELAAQTQRLLDYAEKRAAEGPAGPGLKLKSRPRFILPAIKASKKLRPLLAAEKAGLLAVAQRHFEEDAEGKNKALKQYQAMFLSGNEEQARYYLSDLEQRLDFDTDQFKDQFINLGLLEVFHSLAWKYKTANLAEAVMAITEGKACLEKEPPYTDVLAAAKRFLESFPARNKTPELEQAIRGSLQKMAELARARSPLLNPGVMKKRPVPPAQART